MGTPPPQLTASLLASPLERLGAALLDLGLLLILDVLLFLFAVLSLPSDVADRAFSAAATICSLAYLIILWGRGQTFGKRVFGIKVVGPDGGRPGLLRAALRFIGYVIASLPVKIGFLPILWDPLRRGWHDQIARTIVVKEHADQVPPPPPAEPVAPDETASGAIRWRDLAMLPVFAIATLLLTWPAVARLPSHFPSDGGDANVFCWSLWWVRKALLDPRLGVFQTDYVFWPETVSLRLHSFSLFNCALGVPLQSFLSLTLTYSVLLFLALCLTAFAAYLLGKYVTGSALGGFLVGLFFGFCPYMLWHAHGHLDLVSSEWIVIYMLLIVILLKKAQARCALLAAVALALAALSAWHQLTYAAAFTALFVPAWFVVHRKGIARRIALIALAGILGIALLTPWLVPLARDFRAGNYHYDALSARSRADIVSLDAASLVMPNPYHPLFGRWTTPFYRKTLLPRGGTEQAGYIGFTLPALALFAVWNRRRRRALLPWLATAIACILLSFGFNLRVFARSEAPVPLLLAAGGPPGSGMELPIVPWLAGRVAMGLAGGSTYFLTSRQAVDMPFAWLWEIGGIMPLLSTPGRFAHIANLCLAVLAALGILRLTQVVSARRGKWAGRALAFALAGLVMFEFLMAPRFPTEPVALHPFYNKLARDSRCIAILELSSRGHPDTHFQRAQAIHGKKLYVAFLSRTPDHAHDFVLAHPLLAEALHLAPVYRVPPYWNSAKYASPRALAQARLASYRHDLRALAQTGCRYILLHKDTTGSDEFRRIQLLLEKKLALPIILDDPLLTVYQIPPEHDSQ